MNTLFVTLLTLLLLSQQIIGNIIQESGKLTILVPQGKVGKAASKTYAIFSEKATYRDAARKCIEVGWSLVRVDNNIKQREVEQHVLNQPKAESLLWIDGEHWWGNWYLYEGEILNFTNFYRGHAEPTAVVASPSCLGIVSVNVAGPPINRYKWVPTPCNSTLQFACEK